MRSFLTCGSTVVTDLLTQFAYLPGTRILAFDGLRTHRTGKVADLAFLRRFDHLVLAAEFHAGQAFGGTIARLLNADWLRNLH